MNPCRNRNADTAASVIGIATACPIVTTVTVMATAFAMSGIAARMIPIAINQGLIVSSHLMAHEKSRLGGIFHVYGLSNDCASK